VSGIAPRRFLVSATHKSSGKTTVAIGLCAALTRRGLAVQPFKKGPDFIDPMWLSAATGRRCRNLDPYIADEDEVAATFVRHAAGADVALVEGNKGLYDGVAIDGSNSNAALARMLGLPVMLVIDARGMTRGVAPLVLGYQAFDRDLRIAGVILNQLGGSRHEAKLRAVIEHYTDIPVLGAVHHDPGLAIVERHLGLMPSNESSEVPRLIADIGAAIERQVDVERLMTLAAEAAPLRAPAGAADGAPDPLEADIRIGVAQDRAFGFYYADDLDALRAAGATLVRFDALADAQLPNVDALFIGGGFPEMHARELEANASLRTRIRNLIDAGGNYVTLTPGAAFFDSVLSFALVRSGRLDIAFLGALEISARGDLANWIIPGRYSPGIGGGMELAQKARRVIVTTTHTTKEGRPKILPACTLPITAKACVDTIITELAVIDVTPQGLRLRELSAGTTRETVKSLTAAPLIVPPDPIPEFS